MTNEPRNNKRILFMLLKWGLCAVVIWFVATAGWKMWKQGTAEGNRLTLHWGWLFLAGAIYTVGWLPSVWFWRKMMQQLGGNAGWLDTARAYYCGHLGKYVPGKAMVLVIRGSMLKERGCRFRAAALTAAYETLITMGAGLAVAVALSPWLLSPQSVEKLPESLRHFIQTEFIEKFIQSQWGPPTVVILGCIAILPLLSKLFSKVARKMAPHEEGALETEIDFRISPKLIGIGLLVSVIAWSLHGLSLGLVLKGVSVDHFDLSQILIWMGAVSLATSMGFIALFVPSGAGVREGILMAVLTCQPGIEPHQAVMAALLLRMVWLVTELVVAGVLYFGKKNIPVNCHSQEV